MMFKLDTHIHTSDVSLCAQVEPEEMAGLFEALITMLEKMLGAEAGQLLARAQEYWKFEP